MTKSEIINIIKAKILDYMQVAHAMRHDKISYLKLKSKQEALEYLLLDIDK